MERPRCSIIDLLKSPGRLLCRSAFVGFFVLGSFVAAQEQVASLSHRTVEKRIIGPTTIIAEAKSEMDFRARVDTGAMTSSIHVEEWAIEDESPDMAENVGKKIRFRMKNHRGESQWLESRIQEIALVKTSEQHEERYKVQLTLCWNDVRKRILVTLNDRSHMKYPMLLGRNFLEGDFVVDVDLKKQAKAETAPVADSPAVSEISSK